MSNGSEEPDKPIHDEKSDKPIHDEKSDKPIHDEGKNHPETQTPTKSPSPQLATIRASEERDSVSSDMLSIKSPDIDERELEDVQLNDNLSDKITIPDGKFHFPNMEVQKPEISVQHDESTDEEPVRNEGKAKKEKSPDAGSLSSQIENATVIHASDETAEETFSRLKKGILARSLSQKDIVDGLFNVLVGGPFDLDSRFIIENSENIDKMLDLIDAAPPSLKAEIWSVFVAIVRKSFRNLEACSRVGLISKCLDRLPQTDAVISDLLIQLLSVLTSYSITVKETKHFLRALRASNGTWHRNSAKLLNVMQEMPKRDGADVFFSFPGKASAGIALPPISKWPYQNGWTFSTWLRMDPLNSVNFEKEKPYLFSFSTNKGFGYHCYFMGSCLVLHVTKGPGKDTMKCIKQELVSRKWHHVAISYVYSRWARSEINCFIDGQLAETIDMTWLVNTNDYFDRCYIGCGSDPDPNQAYCGQMGAVYVFAQAISVQQANCLFCLGASYQSYFKHDAESNLPEGYKKHLFDGHLNSTLVFAYCPKNCHGQLCLFPTPKTATMYFVQVPHAIMKEGIEVITTHSIHNSLHSVGGIQMLLPLFAQIDMPHQDCDPLVDYGICSKLLSVISLLLSTSSSAQQQLFHSQGFLIIANVLNTSSKGHLTRHVLEALINMSKFLLTCPAGIPLLKQLFDHLLFNPQLWIRTDAEIQIRLYSFLANDFFANASFLSIVRRTSTIVELMHTLKTYYWLIPPKTLTYKSPDDPRPDKNSIIQVRSHILHLVNRLMFLLPVGMDEKEVNREEEFQCIFNFIGTVAEDDNLYDLLTQTMHQLCDHPAIMVPAFDRKKGVAVIFKLLSSPNELIRLPALKIFGYFICRSTLKRKNESINNLNLLTLLSDRLLMNNQYLSLATYNVLYEILTECMSPEIQFIKHEDLPADTVRFENPALLKVIASLITQSENTEELMRVKKIFIEDMIKLCKDSKENRRTILQMSVWQEWLISLAYIFPENRVEEEITELVFEMFAILLYHAIRLEYGGWRVWVDTLAIAHSKVSWERYRRSIRRAKTSKIEYEDSKAVVETIDEIVSSVDGGESSASNEKSPESIKSPKSTTSSPQAVEDIPSSLYRTPEFVWSNVHIRLLSDLLSAIENVAEEWNDPSSSSALMDHVNNNDNQIFISNTVHVLSQLTDSLIMACGGLLPLLAAATSPNSELEIADTTQQDLSIENAVDFLKRFVNLADVFIFASGISFSELEQEKNMPNGGILRQALRLVSTMAVRNILACRIALKERGFSEQTVKQRAKFDAISKFVKMALELKDTAKGISDVNRLLQEIDLQRLKGVVYRDMEEGRQAQFLALSVVYLLSVLMVSRYRDILEPPTSPSPFFDTNSDSSANRKSVDSPKGSTTKGSPSTSLTNGTNPAESPPHTQVTYLPKIGYENGEKDEIAEEKAKKENDGDGDEGNNEDEDEKPKAISSIPYNNSTTHLEAKDKYNTDQLNRFNTSEEIKSIDASERRKYLTDKLQKALEPVAPLLREIMSDFKSFLQKTLLGTHGQEIMNDVKVMQTLKNQQGSVIELVMLLCSQEWQTSLQKHAGLAFIELVNEGRLMAHATRDHVLRVANEADFILNRLRAEDVSKHAQFDNESAEQLYVRKQDEHVSDHLIVSSRRRDFLVASKLLEKMRTILLSPSGAWCSNDEEQQTFWRLDLWEDDSRRRKRFVPNAYGCKHSMASIRKVLDEKETEELEKAREELLKELSHKMIISTGQPKTSQVLNELVDETDIDKWASEENDLRDAKQDHASYSTQGKLIAPGIVVPGTISITATDLYFDADEDHPLYKQQDPKCLRYCDNLHGRWHFQEIRAIFLRRYLLQYSALELFLASRTAIMFAFPDQETVKKVVENLPRVGVGVKYGLPQSRKTSLMSPRQLFKHSDMPQKWQRREITNFDYLMFLNTIAGRTYNDLNQYPIFPWILANYTSEKLDLSEASNFRDLSKPIGALSENRRKYFQDRFNNWEDESVPPFHYGTHYSTQAFTLNWLFRLEPFTSYFLNLQSGKFDHSDRLFHSLNDAWEHCQRDSHDVKELIPELFYMPEMFYNSNGYELGKRDDGTPVNNVVLPRWASTPEEFILIHRQALESDLVSCQLNQWIDLIFGYKQRGPEAVRATNVFYYLTYEGSINLNAIENLQLRESLQQQILNFGQTPVQLMADPHPPRHSIMTISPLMFQPCHDDLCMLMKFISNSAVVHISANTFPQVTQPTVVSISQNLVFALNKWNNNYTQATNQPSSALGVSMAEKNIDPSHAELPMTVDPLLAVGNPSQPLPKRHLGDAFDQRLRITWSNFVTTVDSKSIVACGYPDYSFRVIDTENASVRQVVYGHGDVVTCLARSEASLYADFYIASGSLDCTVVLWHFSSQNQTIAGEYNVPGETPAPRAILTGHDAEITAICVSAEHGVVISGSKDGTVLMHTTQGDLLRRIVCTDLSRNAKTTLPPVTNILMNRDCNLAVFYGHEFVATFTSTGRQLNRPAHKSIEKVFCATMSRCGEYLVVGTENGRISVVRLFPLQMLYTFPQTDSPTRCVAISTNQRFILGGLESGAIVVFNVDFNKWHFEYKQRYSHR